MTLEARIEALAARLADEINALRVEAGEGGGEGGVSELSALSDVDLTTPPTDKQALSYHAATSKWTPQDAASSIADLTDVDLSGGVGDLERLSYSSADGKWYPTASEDMRNFRGEWEDPANAILWSTDFTNPADATLFDGVTATGSVAAATTDMTPMTVSSFAAIGLPASHITVASYTGSSAPNGTSTLTISHPQISIKKSNISELTGKFIRRVEVWALLGGNQTRSMFTLNAVNITSITYPTTSPGIWQECVIPIGGAEDFDLRLHSWKTAGAPNGNRDEVITGLRFYGSVDFDDLYAVGEVVIKDGIYYRSIYNDNADTPGASVKWQQIIGPSALVSSNRIINMVDVDHSSRVDGSILRWDSATQKYVHDLKPDVVNFRGDWQASDQTLLWSTDFSDPADYNLFVYSEITPIYATDRSRIATTAAAYGGAAPSGTPPSSTYSAGMYMHNNSGSAVGQQRYTLDTSGIPVLAGKYLSRMKLWVGRTSLGTSGTATKRFIRADAVDLNIQDAFSENWNDLEVLISSINPLLRIGQGVFVANTGVSRYMRFTGVRIYGTPNDADLYQVNQVVRYLGNYYRSLFNNNTDLPTNATKWTLVGPVL